MRILAIETSADETAVAVLEVIGEPITPTVTILGNALLSQIDIHKKYGGIFPMMAKREHARAVTPLLKDALKQADLFQEKGVTNEALGIKEEIETLLAREEGLSKEILTLLEKIERPDIDTIAVTHGPGLEPALWVGVNFATALALAWNIPLIPINHMEGHILSSLLVKRGVAQDAKPITPEKEFRVLRPNESEDILSTAGRMYDLKAKSYQLKAPAFPLLALLISGGHTELVLMEDWGKYKVIGETKDDAVGEAYDKVARMLGLPYPGGPEISKLAEEARQLGGSSSKFGEFKLPRPMLHSTDLNFSFAGLKTAVLYTVKKIEEVTDDIKKSLALEFENAVAEVLAKKTEKAIEETTAQTVVVGGGVSANKNIRKVLSEMIKEKFPNITFYIPEAKLTTDNAIMIGLAGYTRFKTEKDTKHASIKAVGNLKL